MAEAVGLPQVVVEAVAAVGLPQVVAAVEGSHPSGLCMKHPHPLKTNPMRTTITKIPANFVFINLSSFYLVGTTSKYKYTPHKP